MRKQTRPPTPQALIKHGERWSREWAELREKNPSASFRWHEIDGKSAREWLLPALKEMTLEHCAFCDYFRFDTCSMETVEHFRPKSAPQFYADAYAWENLYYCCSRCQIAKGEKWDDRLLRPDVPEYVFELYFQFDYTEGEIHPNAVASTESQERARATIKLYDLNRPALCRDRKLKLREWQRPNTEHELDSWSFRDFLEGG